MTIEFKVTHLAKVRGWCRGKAYVRVETDTGSDFWILSTAPDTPAEAEHINEVMQALEKASPICGKLDDN